ncbi:ribose 1,5-bisphosphate phosphokinase PhnN [Variibacter gotjawalensis]|uniref:ribose 1,5-bisphosphate phosphokinase n=1 Tax=Variibacter gotjawalensis TaxID=1333996 RepID=A0A0S3PTH5_9BRAD|nr:phosphonate metabolism protein/1,5-bisphosphokinase (PRPP-forming) PhnN [Variibacter gotjawalensis]NIK49435.1 ribose 1,5-bisphosphokinase [Variibacter gotjawalensis]RZS51287.1 ribose 1,5-bisphosphokinase [Variibacter gotjawalensis]BAT59120.1 ribose 1,5-bisphosphate phosphokinase PhnN [Variibacter gotjawalensis]
MIEKIGPGYLVLIVGPSGAGKDTVLNIARETLDRESFHFPVRIVTRRSDVTEATQYVTSDDFERVQQLGGLSFVWRAHGLSYGLPRSMDDEIGAGRNVVSNVSRGIVKDARERYRNCFVILITANAATRAERLAARGRENPDELAARLSRETLVSVDFEPDAVIENETTPDQAARSLVQLLDELRQPALGATAAAYSR